MSYVRTQVHAYAAPASGEPLAPTTIERREVGANDVLIAIEYAGICHSDIHTVNGDWGPQPFPVVPGHEIVGVVAEVGSGVTRHRVGDRVGVGCLVNSCRECESCRNGDEQYCLDGMVPTYAGTDRDGTTTQGGYSTHVVVDADYVLTVPEALDPAAAAGVVYFNNIGYLGMCGHGLIGVVRTLEFLGTIRPGVVRIDTPVGLVTAMLAGLTANGSEDT